MNTSTPTRASNTGTTPAGATTAAAGRSDTPQLDRIEAFLLLNPVLEFIDRRCKRLVFTVFFAVQVPYLIWHFLGPNHGYLPYRWLRPLDHLVFPLAFAPCVVWPVVHLGRQEIYKVLWRIRQRHAKAAGKDPDAAS